MQQYKIIECRGVKDSDNTILQANGHWYNSIKKYDSCRMDGFVGWCIHNFRCTAIFPFFQREPQECLKPQQQTPKETF